MIITIQTIDREFTKTGKEYLKVTGITGDGKQTTKSIFDNLKEKWELLVENATLEFVMQKVGQFWNVTDIKKPELIGEKAQEPTKVTPTFGKLPMSDADKKLQSIEKQSCLKDATQLMSAFVTLGKMKEINADTPAKLADQTSLMAKRLYNNIFISTDKIVEKIEEAIKED